MGWFDDQIKVRIKNDEQAFENSFIDLSSVVIGKERSSDQIYNERIETTNAIEEILKYYKAKIIELPMEIEGVNSQLEYLLRPTGIMYRKVLLKGKWWNDAIGPMLGKTKDGKSIALMPHGLKGYRFFDYEKDKNIKINEKTKDLINQEAVCFYKPLPLKPIKIRDLLMYIRSTITKSDVIMIVSITAAVTLIGLLIPWVTQQIYNKVVPSKEIRLLIPVIFLYLGVEVSRTLLNTTKALITNMTQSKMNMAVSSAAMSRLMSLPAKFFKDYTSGELADRTFKINQLCGMLSNIFFTTGLSSIFSFAYIVQLASFTPSLVLPSLAIILTQFVFIIFSTFISLNITRKKMKLSAKLSGLIFSLFSGIQKIKLSGSEKRAFSKWANLYKDVAKFEYDPPWVIKFMPIFSTIVSSAGLLFIYFFAAIADVSQANYMAFNMAYGQVSGAILALAGIASTFANIRPVMEMVEPILKAQPEISEGKKIVTKVAGGLEVNNISFRYSEKTPLVLESVSLKIKPGQYLAIVGKTGCGKSTLMRLLLGFEKPEKGAIYYDGMDIESLDLKSLRQNIGVVMQNGKLFSGDVFSNIVISAPWLNLDDAWQSAEMAGIKKDIEDMPMGMHTIISEGSGGVSGGQKQRLMIARAIAPKPKILMFDEATSALDNITQKQVSDSLDSLKSTRIIIAHRLSTIKHCDRIIVLEKGKIVEDGNYKELTAKKGYFADLVERQRVGEKI